MKSGNVLMCFQPNGAVQAANAPKNKYSGMIF